MGGADRPERTFEKFNHFFHAVAELETRRLKLTRKMAYVLAGGHQQIHPARSEFIGLGLVLFLNRARQ
jgi:hypothetical protein